MRYGVIHNGRQLIVYRFKMSLIEKDMVEPTIRLIYIWVCSLIFELFLSCGVATITVGNITTDSIKTVSYTHLH